MAYDFSANAVRTTLIAGADLSEKQFHFVEVSNADGTVTVCDNLADRPIGVLQNTPKSGEAADVLIVGGSKVAAGGTASPGQALFTSASGTAITVAFGAAAAGSAAFVLGSFIEPAAAGAITTAVINCANSGRGA
jgi:hypothetical protein